MTKIHHIPFRFDEWLAGTVALDAVDVGVYIQAIALIYSHGGEVEREELRRVVRCHGTAFKASLGRLLALGKLVENGTKLTSKRCLNELETARKRVENLCYNGAKGGRPPKKINEIAKPDGFYARAKGNQNQIKEDSKNLLGEDLGRCAPSEAPAATVEAPPETPAPRPEVVAAPEPPEPSPPATPDPDPPITAEDRAYMAQRLGELIAQMTGEAPRAPAIRDPVAYERARTKSKRDNWLDLNHAFASEHFDGQARWDAWEAIDIARRAGSREATPAHVSKLLESLNDARLAAAGAERVAA
jgi:hypothetical protein